MQEVAFPTSAIRDVAISGQDVSAVIEQPEAEAEALAFRLENEADAHRLRKAWPTTRSPESLEIESYLTLLTQRSAVPLVTYSLIAACVLVFVLQLLQGVHAMNPDSEDLIRWGSNYALKTFGGEPARLVTSMFLHVGVIHMIVNMYALLVVGPFVERSLGRGPFLALYLFAGVMGSFASASWNPVVNSAGASGAVFGVLGATMAITLKPDLGIPRSYSRVLLKNAAIWATVNVFYGLRHPGIDNAAHIGGALAGFGLAWFLAVPVKPDTDGIDEPRSPVVPLTLAAGLLLLLIGPRVFPGPELEDRRLLQQQLYRVLSVSQQATRLEMQIMQLANGDGGNPELAARLETEVLPLIESMRAEVTSLAPSSERRTDQFLRAQDAMIEFLQLRAYLTETLIRAAAASDAAALNDTGQLQRRVDQRASGMRREVARNLL